VQRALNRSRSSGVLSSSGDSVAMKATGKLGPNRGVLRSLLLSLVLGLSACGDAASDGVSYRHDVAPMFARGCVYCHHSNNTLGVPELEDPFALDPPPGVPGMVVAQNTWAEAGYDSLPRLVVPFEPDQSFLVQKLTDTTLTVDYCQPAANPGPDCPIERNGGVMPPVVTRLTADEISTLRQWIRDGAANNDFFQTRVAPIFGDPLDVGTGGGKCASCHYPGTPNLPDLSVPFDPVRGIVGVTARFRSDLQLVDPGDPDSSFLVMRVEAVELTQEVGAPMPLQTRRFDETQIAVLRQWILEGAKDN
jgi:hypothetical protein